MTNIKLEEEIEIIQRMMHATRKKAMDSGNVFILWGVLVLAATGLVQTLVWLNLSTFINVVIWLFPVVGIVFTLYLKKKREQATKVKFFVDKIVAATWFACGLGIAVSSVIFFISPTASSLDIVYVSVVMLFIGIGVIISGAAYQWRMLTVLGVLWCIAALIVQFIPPSYLIISIPLIFGVGMIVPGMIANYELNKLETKR